jgi:hypothetical protein
LRPLQVDGTRARRSPGSTLKPFIYALALDAGLIQPQTLLDDAPKRFSGYNPENSDRQFLGPIAASKALRLSRNVPAVDLANRLPQGGLEGFLRVSDVELPSRSHGLALAIGATEMRLEDLAKLYAALARPRQGRLSPEACWLTLNALRCDDPGAPIGLACKTGTSNGFRDAWACGVMGDWVLCVWVGHFSGRSMPGLFASETAAPLLWQTVSQLDLPDHSADETRPQEVVQVAVCAVSGDLNKTDSSSKQMPLPERRRFTGLPIVNTLGPALRRSHLLGNREWVITNCKRWMMRDGFPAEGLALGWRWVGLEDRGILGGEVVFFLNLFGEVEELPVTLFGFRGFPVFPVFHADGCLSDVFPIKTAVVFLSSLACEGRNEGEAICFRALGAGNLRESGHDVGEVAKVVGDRSCFDFFRPTK